MESALTKHQLTELREVTKDDIRRFTLGGMKVQAKVVKVHDGDTCDLAFYLDDSIERFKCRLTGIDAIELDEEDDEGRDGETARNFLAWLSIGKKPNMFEDEDDPWTKEELQKELDKSSNLVYAILGGFEKYGRVLVTIKASKYAKKSFNQLLVDYEYATESN